MRARLPLCAALAITIVAPAGASADFPHVVAPGETLSSVAASDGLSVEQLAAANGLTAGSQLLAGSTLMIPEEGAGAAVSGAGAGEAGSSAEASTAEIGEDRDADDAG